MPQTYIDIQNGYANMVTVKRIPQVSPMGYWHCPISTCGNTGGRLGFAGAVGILQTRNCWYCDAMTKQITVKA